ncbi:MAG: 3-oxoacid CoA-transferase subunit B [Dehalococcoidia bacterium]|nr:3-oxoacid CoA-transferase subunit B [Dehalococcoidia bacterium]
MKQPWTKEEMAQKAAARLENGFCVNLGFGMPTAVAEYIPEDIDVMFHSENGILGYGPKAVEGESDYDPDLGDAGGVMVTTTPGMSIFDHPTSFAIIRGGHLDATVLGALQVSEKGDLANWKLPTKKVGSTGGAMDLAVGAKRVIAMMTHTARDGEPKILKECTYELTGKECVTTIVTDLAVIDVTEDGLVVADMASGYTLEDIQAVTGAPLKAASGLKQ